MPLLGWFGSTAKHWIDPIACLDELTELWGSPLTMIPLDRPHTPRRALIDRAESLAKDLAVFIARKRAMKEDTGDALAALVRAVDEDGSVVTEDELLGQLFLLFAVGFGSSMAGLAWTAYLLAQHPAVAADLQDEITATLRGAPPTVDDLARMPRLEGVIKSTRSPRARAARRRGDRDAVGK